ncbi:hypothetical protein [Streptomyces sp. ST2-7A]|uniref:hypothetical protein n=1 Tax=Streptomyces sp. ST2-7A TaxID=2907214 RepID=UPI001F38EB24|nr:hypothetical protein [Streptomyces sp. ST2-7A]MCE7078618.1 hypothetical protein [Streptomyces sp. ST2-7A]
MRITHHRRSGGRRARPRGAGAAGLAALLALSTAGCGIRSMDVPVDAGPAPSRASCAVPEHSEGVDVYLVCGSRVESVPRDVPVPDPAPPGAEGSGDAGKPTDPTGSREVSASERLAVAGRLLRELQSEPPEEEQAAGFSSAVPEELRVTGPSGNDPERLLRLSLHPDDLPAFALVQIICTFAHTRPVGDGTSVLLGGPPDAEDREARGYTCASSLRNRPENARNAGTEVILPPPTAGETGESATG